MLDAPEPRSADDVLAQPTRARLFALLVELKRSAGTAELATRLGLHPNGVRIHLERLETAGLVARAQVRAARGRPPDAWMIAPDARPHGEPPRAYRDLGRWLARAMSHGRLDQTELEETGREIGRELAPTDTAPGIDAVERVLSALGFQPRPAARAGETVALSLCNCPYRDAVRENQPAICALHKGLTAGLLEVLAPRAELAGFVPHDPDVAGCVVEIRA